ncbi:MAG: hypothetical protein EBU88_09150, partial [Acidobacteria bacterium]|nr:hypothetical protein [Acidobacteriota bacterium]
AVVTGRENGDSGMGSKNKSRAEETRGSREAKLARKTEPTGLGRRRLILAGAGGAGLLAVAAVTGYRAGWFGGATPEVNTAQTPGTAPPPALLPPVKMAADRGNAIKATTEIVSHYTNLLRNASSSIHALRGLGRRFSLQDGTNIVDHLTSTYPADREVNGQRYIYIPREYEVHDNSFLKTFLEAGLSPQQVLVAKGGNRYTLNDLGNSAKSLFRFDPGDLRRYDPEFPENHLPWCLIALSRLAPPENSTWVNAYGEKIDLSELVDIGLVDFEGVCNKLAIPGDTPHGENVQFRGKIVSYSCFGMHSFYGFFSAYRNGYRVNNYERRIRQLFNHLIERLDRDVVALEEETVAARIQGQQYVARMGNSADGKRRGQGGPPAELIDVMSLKHFIVTIGHAIEAINFVRLNNLLPITPGQISLINRHESRLFEALTRMRSYNLDTFFKWDPKFVSDIVIGLGHALRAMKLLGPDNPDIAA